MSVKFLFRRKKKNANSSIAAILNVTRAFSAPFASPSIFSKLKKEKWIVIAIFSPYGRFLVTSIARTTPIMTITMMIATIPYSSVVFDAKPESGVAVGGAVAPDGLA